MATPFLSVSLHSLTPKQIDEYDWWPGNTDVEIYQTWTLADVAQIADTGAPTDSNWVRMGFSTTGGLRGFTAFGPEDVGREFDVIDPKLELGLKLEPGQSRQLMFDVAFWEQDNASSSEKVKLLSSNDSLKTLVNLWKANQENQDKAKAALRGWLDNNLTSIVGAAIAAISPAASGVAQQSNLLPLVKILADLALEQGDAPMFNQQLIIRVRNDETHGHQFCAYPVGSSVQPVWSDGIKDCVIKSSDSRRGNTFESRFRIALMG
jgi:hypothetical protein